MTNYISKQDSDYMYTILGI